MEFYTINKCAENVSAFLKKIKLIILAHTAKIIAIGFGAMKICSFNGINDTSVYLGKRNITQDWHPFSCYISCLKPFRDADTKKEEGGL